MNEDLRGQSWVRTFQDVMAMLPGLVGDRLELLALELQRAGRAIVHVMALVVATAILGTTAWLALCAGLGLMLVTMGLSWPLALLAVLLVNLALAWAAVTRARRLLVNLGLPATRRHLVFGAKAPAAQAGAPLHHQQFTSQSEGRP